MTVSEQKTTTFPTNNGAILPILLSVGIIMRQEEGGNHGIIEIIKIIIIIKMMVIITRR